MSDDNNNQDFNTDTEGDYEIPNIPDEDLGYIEKDLGSDNDMIQK